MNDTIGPKSSYDFAGLGELKAKAASHAGDDATIKKAAQQFEAMFLQMMLKSMRDAVPKGGLFDSQETQTFEQMLDQQFALAMADRGSTGLSQMVERFIRQSQGVSATESDDKNFYLDATQKSALPLVKESARFKISEGSTQNFLLQRDQLRLKGDQR